MVWYGMVWYGMVHKWMSNVSYLLCFCCFPFSARKTIFCIVVVDAIIFFILLYLHTMYLHHHKESPHIICRNIFVAFQTFWAKKFTTNIQTNLLHWLLGRASQAELLGLEVSSAEGITFLDKMWCITLYYITLLLCFALMKG